MKLGNFYFYILFLLMAVSSCNSTEIQNTPAAVLNKTIEDSIIIKRSISSNNTFSIKDTSTISKVVVVQCSNGYTYAMGGYDFNPIIEAELNKFSSIKVEAFPLKKLVGVIYQGVFDKKYCKPIIKKVNADFLILTRFQDNFLNNIQSMPSDTLINLPKKIWGYELRIVNTKTMKQVNSIQAHNLSSYKQIEQHIKENIATLQSDIVKLKRTAL